MTSEEREVAGWVEPASVIPLGMSIGMLIGVSVGVAIDDLALAIGVGTAVGTALGGLAYTIVIALGGGDEGP